MVTLAPGLVAYRLPDKVDAGELFDGTKVIGKVTRSAARWRLGSKADFSKRAC